MCTSTPSSSDFDPDAARASLRSVKLEELDLAHVNEPLMAAVRTALERLESETRQPTRFFFIVRGLLETSIDTYKVIRKLVGEDPKFPAQAHLLCRPMLDAVFTLAALCTKPDEFAKWYMKAGWRQACERFELEREYTPAEPPWVDVMAQKKRFFESFAEFEGIPPEERKDPKRILHWPTPPQMLSKREMLSPDLHGFLQKLYEQEYGKYFEQSHAGWLGIVMGMSSRRTNRHVHPGKGESDAVYLGMLCLLMMVSEVEGACRYGLSRELQYLWVFLGEYFLQSKEYYELRYRGLLSANEDA